MDILRRSSKRITWIHKDDTDVYMQSLKQQSPLMAELVSRPCTQPIIQTCEGDTIEIAINVFSAQGLTSDIVWFDPFMQDIPSETVLNYRGNQSRENKISCDLRRVCEVEDHVCEWYDKQFYYKPIPEINTSKIQRFF